MTSMLEFAIALAKRIDEHLNAQEQEDPNAEVVNAAMGSQAIPQPYNVGKELRSLFANAESDTPDIPPTELPDGSGMFTADVQTPEIPMDSQVDDYGMPVPVETPAQIPAIPVAKPVKKTIAKPVKKTIARPSSKNYGGGIKGLIAAEARRLGLPVNIAMAVAQSESGFNPRAKSPAGAIGAFQLMPQTAKGLGVNPYDTNQNIHGGVKMLKQLHRTYGGDINKIAAAYNAGSGAVAKYGGVPPYAETRQYVKRVKSLLGKY